MKKITQDVRKLGVTAGTTYFMTFPQEMIKQLKWKKGEKKIVQLLNDRIIIKDWIPK